MYARYDGCTIKDELLEIAEKARRARRRNREASSGTDEVQATPSAVDNSALDKIAEAREKAAELGWDEVVRNLDKVLAERRNRDKEKDTDS